MPFGCMLKNPCFEATVYTAGMLLVTLGVGLLVATSNRRQFSSELWYTLVAIGILAVVIGLIIAILSCRIPTYRNVTPDFIIRLQNSSSASMEEMLDDVTSVGSADSSSVVEIHDPVSAERSAEVVRNCMMLQDKLPPLLFVNGSLLKETYV